MNFTKQLASFILPVTVLIIVPLWIEDHAMIHMMSLIFGSLLIITGLVLMTLTIAAFIKIGRGTLAPWSPTRKLVIAGLFAYVRNPMILGVWTVLLGESLAILSLRIFIWAIAFFIINTVYFIFSEEPGVEKRFGDEYREYKKNVPRWIPRRTPFSYQENHKKN